MIIVKPMHFLAAIALTISPTAAFARAKIVASTPAANATVTKPAKITLSFNETLSGPTVKVELFMTAMAAGMKHDGGMDHSKMDHSKMAGAAMTDHAPAKIPATSQLGKDGKSVTLTPKRALPAGKYMVSWTAAGSDMQKTSGSHSFTVR